MAEVQDINIDMIKLQGSDTQKDEDSKLAESIKRRQQNWEVHDFSISRVPARIRQEKEAYYEPSIVSIGPYHRGKPKLQDMENLKWRQLSDFLARRPGIDVKTYIEKLRSLEKKARRCYIEPINLSSDEFVEMMLLDGCYILEFFWKFDDVVNGQHRGISAPIRYYSWITPHVLSDFCLLENQIPFFILQSLLGENDDDRLLRLVSKALHDIEPKISYLPSHKNIHHLLHLAHHCYFNKQTEQQKLSQFRSYLDSSRSLMADGLHRVTVPAVRTKGPSSLSVPCAVNLVEAGVTFKLKKSPETRMDITFHRGVVEIPSIDIDDSNKILLMNLVAYEQINFESHGSVILSNYAAFMDCIINTARDVEILRQCGILSSSLNSDEETAKYFNTLGDYVRPFSVEESDLAAVARRINKYRRGTWNQWRAKLVREYFSSPWAIISLGAAVVLLILTFLQTFFAMYVFFRPQKSS